MFFKKTLFLIVFLFVFNIQAQSRVVKVLDSISLSPVPFATIYFSNNKGIITDENGYFELINEQFNKNDSIFISSMGFKKKALQIKSIKDGILYMSPKAIVLENIILTNKNLSSEEIIDRVKKNIENNYQKDITEKKVYYSQERNQIIKETNITKFKSSIKEINSSLLDSLLQNIKKQNKNEIESLSYYYGNNEENKQKIKLIKSRETYKKDEDELLESIESRLEESLKNNLKSNSYFKVRSGLIPFSGNLEIDGLWDVDSTSEEYLKKTKEDELKRKQGFANFQKNRISSIYSKLFYNDKPGLDFILKSKKYNFSSPELTYLGKDLVYVIYCKPSGSRKFKSALYINSEDFAIVRIDFENIKPLYKFKLLGVFYSRLSEAGRMIFSKINNQKYDLSYFQVTIKKEFGLDRPLKIIEKNKFVKGRRKQNQISFRINLGVDVMEKHEMHIFKSNPIDLKDFENIIEENSILPEYVSEFTTNFWKEF